MEAGMGNSPAGTQSPPWVLPRWLLVLLGTATLTITVGGMRAINEILAPAFLGLVLVVTAQPLRPWLRRKGLPGWLATVIVAAVVYLVIIGFVLAIGLSVARFATLVPQYSQQASDTADSATSWLSSLGIGHDQTKSITDSLDLSNLAGVLTRILGEVTSLLSGMVFVLIIVFFLAMDGGWFAERLPATPPEHQTFARGLQLFATGTRRYILVSSLFGLIVSVFDTVGLWLMGIPAPLVWGLLAFITNYIPNVGFVIGLVPVAILAYLHGGVGLMVAVIAFYCVVNFVIQQLIQPRIVGDAVGLSTTLTFVSLAFWTFTIGPLGAILAVPASLFAKALLIDVDPVGRWLAPLVGGTGFNPDQNEAAEQPPPAESSPAPAGG
jgi:AI-2 transport protein TqsA